MCENFIQNFQQTQNFFYIICIELRFFLYQPDCSFSKRHIQTPYLFSFHQLYKDSIFYQNILCGNSGKSILEILVSNLPIPDKCYVIERLLHVSKDGYAPKRIVLNEDPSDVLKRSDFGVIKLSGKSR